MNEQLVTVSLLLMNAAMLLMVAYLSDIRREVYRSQDDSLIRLVLHRLGHSADRERRILQRIAQVKTRLADEERDDQRAKRRDRDNGGAAMSVKVPAIEDGNPGIITIKPGDTEIRDNDGHLLGYVATGTVNGDIKDKRKKSRKGVR